MPSEPEPPRITILDPQSPAAPDVPALDDRPRNRRRRTLVPAGLLLAAVALAGTARMSAAAQHRADERRLDRAANDNVHLRLLPDPQADASERYRIRIVNDGPAVQLVSERVDYPGYREQPTTAALPAGVPGRGPEAEVLLDTLPACSLALIDAGPEQLLVRVRTERDTVTTVALPLGEVADALQSIGRARCGVLPVDASVGSPGLRLTSTGRELRVDARFTNVSVLPVGITDVTSRHPAAYTVAVDQALPLMLEPASTSGGSLTDGREVALTVRVHIKNCTATRAIAEFSLSDLVDLRLERDGETATVQPFNRALEVRPAGPLLAGCR